MLLAKEYEAFLSQLKSHGFSEFDFIKFLRNYYFPRTATQLGAHGKIKEVNHQERDYSKYTFNGEKNLTKRKTVHSLISFLLIHKKVPIAELNRFSKENRLTPMTRPLVNEIEAIPTKLLPRYFSKEDDLILVKGVKYAVYNQFGGDGFDKMRKLFNNEYHFNIKKQ